MKRNWLAAFVGTMLWGAGGIFTAYAAPARASDPAYFVCPYLAEDFHGSYAYGSDWYLLGPDAKDADAFLAALEADDSDSVAESKDVPCEATCTIDKSTGESYARYLVEQVYKLYFADRSPRAVADPSDASIDLCPAEEDYLSWKQDQLAYSDAEIRDALATESSAKPEKLELEPATPRQYDWDLYDYAWDGADDPAFADESGAYLIDETAPAEEAASTKTAASDYAEAERLSAFEEYALWEETYGDCAEAAEAWAAVQDEEDAFARFWDDVVISGELYVAPATRVPAESVVTIVMNGSPKAVAFDAAAEFARMEREEDTYPREILAAWNDRLDLPVSEVANVVAASRADVAPVSTLLETAADRVFGLGESARRMVRDFVLSDDERSVLRQVAATRGETLLQ